MDKYTQTTKTWLESRFKTYDSQGIYQAHQPTYGFRKGNSELGILERYIRTYQIMTSLTHLKFGSLLDVGGAEGYKAYIVKQLFDVKVVNSDISEEACKRAKEIFHIESVPGDIHNLPFSDSEFDVVLCSETLEHVADHRKAVFELLRVANKAVVITVPHESGKVLDKNIHDEIPHGHIHDFNLESFNYLTSEGYYVSGRKMVTPSLTIPGVLIEAMPREYQEGMGYPKLFFRLYNFSIPFLKKMFGEKTAAFLIRCDDPVCRFTRSYNASLFVILKDNDCYSRKVSRKISPREIMRFAVPFHYIKSKES